MIAPFSKEKGTEGSLLSVGKYAAVCQWGQGG